ncbi:hypothetical protein BOTBODRAFT_639063 [Botryobasidium botryosum FD-172 SS1]|uniref:Protein kinase domain-containing protein n=1 Tax=Botryobasidium botryosum (strain FD-172 SS1) TaxID=930990 RepID=A0A067MT85_BOTB1|nr:hypothetical protein BOTBODRAFT_639063 [Botryobasidium botryosum FD-172 SS1]
MQARMLGQGGFGDCYLGIFFGRLVVSKRLRFYYERDNYMKSLLHEASIWRELDHPNIIPFLGLPSINGIPHLMSPLMQNGTADEFVKKNPHVNRVHLLIQTAQGLEHMHMRNPPIIHGDLKANNVLVSEDGAACLSDFGLARAHAEPSLEGALAPSVSSASTPITMAYRANFRWGAPEVFLDDRRRTPASDIYSLGRLEVELLTGKIPFPDLKSEAAIMQRAVAGRYDRPTDSDTVACGLDDGMWALILECWDLDPSKRPSASQVVERLRRLPEPASVNPNWKPRARAVGEDGERSSSIMSTSSRASDSTAASDHGAMDRLWHRVCAGGLGFPPDIPLRDFM